MRRYHPVFSKVCLTITALLLLATQAHGLERISANSLWNKKNGWIILDARPKKAWAAGHIPGSLPFGWQEYTEVGPQKIPYRTFPPAKMAKALGKLGISEKTPIAIVGDADTTWGGEGWIAWLLTWTGHKGPIALLEGGTPGWKNQNRAWTKNHADRPPLPYTPSANRSVFISAQTLRQNPDAYTIVDTRSFPEWIRGRIPGAIHIPWKKMVDRKSKTPISSEKLKTLLQKEGASLEKPVVYYCTGGIRSAWSWMAHTMAGLPTALNLEGGYEEWQGTAP